MAYLVKRKDGRIEIRESVATAAGPRARTLVVFRGALTPEAMEQAAARARRPVDVERLLAQAEARGIEVSGRRADRAAREVLAALRRGSGPGAPVREALRQALEAAPLEEPLDPELAEVVEWIGVPAAERGRVLRELLRTYDRILASRPRRRLPRRKPFPRFRSRPERPAAKRGARVSRTGAADRAAHRDSSGRGAARTARKPRPAAASRPARKPRRAGRRRRP